MSGGSGQSLAKVAKFLAGSLKLLEEVVKVFRICLQVPTREGLLIRLGDDFPGTRHALLLLRAPD